MGERRRQPALAHRGKIFSYGRLLALMSQWSERLEKENIPAGACVATVGDYSPDAVALTLALLLKKALWVPLLETLPEEEIKRRMEITCCDFRIDIKSKRFTKQPPPNAHSLIEKLRASQCAGLTLFSSGSSGEPKAMLQNLDRIVNARRPNAPIRQGVRVLAMLMFDHIGGINTLFTSLARGNLLITMQRRKSDEIGGLVQQHRAEILPLSPSQASLMLAANVFDSYDFSSVKVVTYGAEPMSAALLEALNQKLPQTKFLQTFGTSETDIAKTRSRSSDSLDIQFTNPEDEHKIVNGELWLRSNRNILGYLNADMDAFTEDGWFKTGDLVEESGGGFFRILGRKSDVINVGGQKLLPVEVEKALMSSARVADCAVYGEKNALLGQHVAADVLLQPPFSGEDKNVIKRELRKLCLAKLEKHKVPARFYFVEKIAVSDRAKKIRGKKSR